MGNSHNDPQPTLSNENLQQFTLPQYGGVVLVDKLNRIIYKDFNIYNHEHEQFQKLLKNRLKLHHPNLAQIIDYKQMNNESSNFCSSSTKKYRIAYNLYVYSLFNQIQNCCKVRKSLPEREICRIFEGVVECLAYLHSMRTIHGDIKVGSIFMDKQRNVKLIDSFFVKQGKTSYQVVLQDPRSMSLLAPEQLDLLKIKLFDTLQQSIEKQIFMVGMSMIQSTTIQEGMRCYDLDSLRIRDEFFIYMMEQIQSCGYSYHLSNLIMNCVHKNPKSRPNFQQFLSNIRQIKNHQLQRTISK